MNLLIFETDDFVVKAHDKPHHSRENGGHVVITPKQRFATRYEMPLELAAKLMHLSMVVGEAVEKVMKLKDIGFVRINFQDNSNWAYKEPKKTPHLHIHLYIRTLDERHPDSDPRFQAFPNALFIPDRKTGYYDNFKPLTEQGCADIGAEIKNLLKSEKYQKLVL